MPRGAYQNAETDPYETLFWRYCYVTLGYTLLRYLGVSSIPATKTWLAVLQMSTIVLIMSTEASALGDLLFGKTRSRLLATLYSKPDTHFFARQLARHIHGSAGTVQRELLTLASAGLIVRSSRENQVLYQANSRHPIFPELHSLLAKTTGVFSILSESIAPFAQEIEFAFVYGSFARGEEKAESDIDLMVIGEVTLDDLLHSLTSVEKKLGRPVNPTVFARQEVRTRIHTGNHFLKALQSASLVFLIGSENDFREIR
ncbi:putative nucleotidyltransferase [Terriglobus roseus DSM 18391]|uniref:Putative nucleotidyltransferase n=2 Tax=Terriglobus roseus TaxID=392734 RepID=I3ZJ49_TERRK|nr:putative nucleotidyltransferase [Terriglobus roseus DSM 18391]